MTTPNPFQQVVLDTASVEVKTRTVVDETPGDWVQSHVSSVTYSQFLSEVEANADE